MSPVSTQGRGRLTACCARIFCVSVMGRRSCFFVALAGLVVLAALVAMMMILPFAHYLFVCGEDAGWCVCIGIIRHQRHLYSVERRLHHYGNGIMRVYGHSRAKIVKPSER